MAKKFKFNKNFFKKENLKQKTSQFPLKKLIVASFLLNILNIAVIVFLKSRIPPEVPLFYGLAQGKEQLSGLTYALIIPSIVALSIVIINSLAIYLLDSEYFKKILVISAFAVTIMASIAVYKIIFLVGSI